MRHSLTNKQCLDLDIQSFTILHTFHEDFRAVFD